jgi:hypothetical protein
MCTSRKMFAPFVLSEAYPSHLVSLPTLRCLPPHRFPDRFFCSSVHSGDLLVTSSTRTPSARAAAPPGLYANPVIAPVGQCIEILSDGFSILIDSCVPGGNVSSTVYPDGPAVLERLGPFIRCRYDNASSTAYICLPGACKCVRIRVPLAAAPTRRYSEESLPETSAGRRTRSERHACPQPTRKPDSKATGSGDCAGAPPA